MSHCTCGFDIGDPRVSRHSDSCASKRLSELEAENDAWERYWMAERKENTKLRKALLSEFGLTAYDLEALLGGA